jgi:hypothetical protein
MFGSLSLGVEMIASSPFSIPSTQKKNVLIGYSADFNLN